MTVDGATVAVVSAGYEGKRPFYERMAALGARLVMLDEPGHWSEQLVAAGVAARCIPVRMTGDADADAALVLEALSAAAVQPDGVLSFWEVSVPVAARLAAALGLPGNPVEAVDTARSKLRTRVASAGAGLPTPAARSVASLDELYAAASEVGFPAVVKPEFGAGAIGAVRVDSFESLPDIYWLVRRELERPHPIEFSTNELILEQYLDGVEFDVDLVFEGGRCVFSSVSQNWPTAEPSFQETGLHCPHDHSSRAVGRLVELAVQTAQALGFVRGVLHIEGKCTSDGPRIVEVNARLGGGRINQVVEAVWGVDLVEAQLRAALDLPQRLSPSRKPKCTVVNALVYAPASGRLTQLPLRHLTTDLGFGVIIDVDAEVGQLVDGPDRIFATEVVEAYVCAKNLRRARSLVAEVLPGPPIVEALPGSGAA